MENNINNCVLCSVFSPGAKNGRLCNLRMSLLYLQKERVVLRLFLHIGPLIITASVLILKRGLLVSHHWSLVSISIIKWQNKNCCCTFLMYVDLL